MRLQPGTAGARGPAPEHSPAYLAVVRSVGVGLVALSTVAACLVVAHQAVSGGHDLPGLVLVALGQVAVVAAAALLVHRVLEQRPVGWPLVLGWGVVVLLAMLAAGARDHDVEVPVRVATMLGPAAAVASALRLPLAHATMVLLLGAGWWVEHRAAPAWATVLTVEVAVFYAFMAIAFLVVRRTAAAAEQTIADLAETERLARASAAVAQERVRRLRLLHDTVLSTLTAVARGVPAAPEALRRRGAEDLLLLEREAVPTPGGDESVATAAEVAAALARIVDEARAGGLVVDASLPATAPPVVLTSAAADALVGGAREALANVARHSGTGGAAVALEWLAGEGRVLVADEGRGFDPGAPHGVGLTECVHGRAAAAGGTAEVVSAPGSGTRVGLVVPTGPVRAPAEVAS